MERTENLKNWTPFQQQIAYWAYLIPNDELLSDDLDLSAAPGESNSWLSENIPGMLTYAAF